MVIMYREQTGRPVHFTMSWTRAASSPPVLLDSGGGSHSATASINDGVFCMCIVYFV